MSQFRESSFGCAPQIRNTGVVRSNPIAERRKRQLFALYLLLVAAFSIKIGVGQAQRDDSFVIGDWLINYSGGFVRRGLPGALAMILHRASGLSLHWVVFAIQCGVFLLLLVCVYRLTKGIRWSYLMVAVLLSPATLGFTVLDPIGIRKEFMLFTALALWIWILISERLSSWEMSAVLAIFLVSLTLSHEGMMAVVPYFLAAVLIQTKSLRKAVSICVVPALLSTMALIAVMLHHGNLEVAHAICDSVGGEMPSPGLVLADGGICTGAIASLQVHATEEHVGMMSWIQGSNPESLYGLLAIPTFAPIFMLLWQFYRHDGLRYEVFTVLVCALASLPGLVALFYVGVDWGRWLHLETMCLLLLALIIDRKSTLAWEPTRWRNAGLRIVAMFVLFLYVTAWTLPGVGNKGESAGYFALFHRAFLRHKFVVRPIGG